MDLCLNGKRALVTAASQGLGRACARALAEEGAQVFICSRSATELQNAAQEMGAAGFLVADVSDAEQLENLVDAAVSVLGGLDILVTNAGGPPTGKFEDVPDEDWALAHDLTLMSAVRLIRLSLPHLRASGHGRIVNLTGHGVTEPISPLVVSDATRAAVTVLGKSLASDLGPDGITVNCIAVGAVLTQRLKDIRSRAAQASGTTLEHEIQRHADSIPVRRLGDPAEVGALCAFLCSESAAFLTGQSIVLDGGLNRAI